ncbi:MAG: hypothetical protein FWH33_05760 [Oscillospiraceae bacterium]|nr:hypothetical protein [Oscillospiraceae bacterium]
MKKILPLATSPITTFPPYATTLSILFNHEDAYDWIYSQYIQIYVIDKPGRDLTDENPFAGCFFSDFDTRRLAWVNADDTFHRGDMSPYLYMFDTPYEYIAPYDTFVSYIKHNIDLSMYVYGLANVGKIAAYKRGGDANHQVLIFGYDDSVEEFYFADFLKDGRYMQSKCKFAEVEAAYRSIVDLPYAPWFKSMTAIKYKDGTSYNFDYQYVKDSVKDYLYPDSDRVIRFNEYIKSSFTIGACKRWNVKVYAGTDVYQYLSEFIDAELRLGRSHIDRRLYHDSPDYTAIKLPTCGEQLRTA